MSSTLISTIPSPPALVPTFVHRRLSLPIKNFSKSKFDGCFWAEQFPDLQQACYLSQICVLNPPKACKFKNISPILQQGPTCGLTCISMLLNGSVEVKHILELAKKQNYTYNGEMFSAKNLCDIAKQVIKKNDSGISFQLYEGVLNCAKVKNLIIEGACLLVPYDPDYNHSPCLKSGHKSHWALIVGYLIDDDNKFYILARHGKTKNIAVWSLKSLSASNANLFEFAQPKGYPNMNFLVPVDGIDGPNGLKNQSIIAQNVENEIITVV